MAFQRTVDRTQRGARCMLCGKGPVASLNRPHSLHKTKRIIKPNVQSFGGLMVCTACIRTLKRKAS